MQKFLYTVAIAVTASFTNAALAEVSLNDRIHDIHAKYEGQYGQIEAEGKRLASEAPDYNTAETTIGVGGTIDWKTTKFSFDKPEVSMKTREFSMHLPQVRMRTKRIVWDNPEFQMEMQKIGEYPCFRGLKIYSCDIKTKVPVLHWVRREAKVDIPEVFWSKTDFSIGIPEVTMTRVELSLDLPQFKVDDVKAEYTAFEDRIDALALRADDLSKAEAAEIAEAVGQDLADKKTSIAAAFDGAIEKLQSAIKRIRDAGADPAAIASDKGPINLLAQLEDLYAKRGEALKTIDAQANSLGA